MHMRKIHKMTSASRSNRGGGGGAGSNQGLSQSLPLPDSLIASADSSAIGGASSNPSQSALVAAAVASMANTQPLALTTKTEESDGERK